MSGYTPGPWTYEGDHTHRQFNIRMLGYLIGTRDEALHICTVNNLPPHILANRDPSTAEANARLIAAAPDMLAALEDGLQWFETGRVDGVAYDEQSVAESFRAAIAKAKGQ